MVDLPLRQKRYGWIPDLPDVRDYPYIQLAVRIPPLPAAVDLRQFCTSVENQGEIGCCTACALVGNLEFLKKKQHHILNFSRLFLYYNERVIRNTQDSDSGASIRDGIKTLVKAGDCREKLWPFLASDLTVKPTTACYQDALNYQIKSYYRLHAITEMQHTLSLGFPFVFGFSVYESFESAEVAKTGIVPLPQLTERVVGGHAVMAVGYNDQQHVFIIRNSWGKQWGLKGYCLMPYEYIMNRNLSSDFWTIRTMA
jgi:C1A family cysteine protease